MSETASQKPFFNIASRLKEQAVRRPYRRAVVAPCTRDRNGRVAYTHLTFRQLDEESDVLAHGLSRIGITRGTRTVLMVKPGIEFFVLTFALFKTGAVPVVVDPGMGIRRMLLCLKESVPKAFIGIPKAHLLRILYPKYFTTVQIGVTVGRRWFWGGHAYKKLTGSLEKPYHMAKTRPNDMAAILFTTGSTGPAKGAVYTHGTFDAQLDTIRSYFEFEDDEIDLPTFPLFALFDPALGITAVIPDMDPTKPARANPGKIYEALYNQGATNMFASPALLHRIERFGTRHHFKLPALRRVVSAGAPVSPAILSRFTPLLHETSEIHTPYGATEAVPVVAMGSNEILSETAGLSQKGFGLCVGRPMPGIDVEIITITDKPIQSWSYDLLSGDGEIGEITVKGGLVSQTYYNRPKADALAKIDDAGSIWHRMGDLGWRDSKGRIWFCGRKSHRVITENGTLFTIPCEAVFNNHPHVFRSALVGVGRRPMQKPVMVVELKKHFGKPSRGKVRQELLDIAGESILTENIDTVLFYRSLPVDIRHNAKINREKLAVWAARKLKQKNGRKR
ncbi:MAG: fatty acid CoA ligase family protein [Desulfobacterales bacterium]